MRGSVRERRPSTAPSGRGATIVPMLIARIICSDPECDHELEVEVAELDELARYGCECGYAFALATVSELADPGPLVISLPERRRGRAERRRAA
jgi:hypothetical protein